jgi:K+-transporting ATPase ATPase C chain
MWKQLKPAFVMVLALTLLTGAAYPALVTGLAQLLMPQQANGSLIVKDGKVVGSKLVGQQWEGAQYFWGRLSATSPVPYNGANSGGSNYGPLNPALKDAVQARVAALKAADPAQTQPIPVDLVTASGSGLDPHISPAAAQWQLSRVAKARNLQPAQVQALIEQYTEGRQWGFLGEARVNVLELNLALDALQPAAQTQ